MQQNWRTPMPKCDFNKAAKQLHWNHTSACVFSCKSAAHFQNAFSYERPWMAASEDLIKLNFYSFIKMFSYLKIMTPQLKDKRQKIEFALECS